MLVIGIKCIQWKTKDLQPSRPHQSHLPRHDTKSSERKAPDYRANPLADGLSRGVFDSGATSRILRTSLMTSPRILSFNSFLTSFYKRPQEALLNTSEVVLCRLDNRLNGIEVAPNSCFNVASHHSMSGVGGVNE